MIVDVLIAMLVVLLLAALPVWPYSRAWGYLGCTGIAAVLLLVGLFCYWNVI